RDEAPAAKTTAATMAHIVHARVTDASEFPRYARGGEEAGYALDDDSTTKSVGLISRYASVERVRCPPGRRLLRRRGGSMPARPASCRRFRAAGSPARACRETTEPTGSARPRPTRAGRRLRTGRPPPRRWR